MRRIKKCCERDDQRGGRCGCNTNAYKLYLPDARAKMVSRARVAICERVAKNIFTTKARYRVPRCVDARAPVHMAQQATYSAVESSDLPPQRWSTGVFECVSDPQVCVMGACPMGCVQYLYAANADSAGVEPFETAFFKACGLTVVVPNVIGAVAATAPAVGAALSPLNTLTSIALAWFGMSNRSYMRRRYNIRGVSECAWFCSCFSFMFDGDEEKTDDFCCYLCCFSCAVCQETRHLRRYNLGTIATRFTPYAADDGTFLGRPAGGYAPPAPAAMRREAIPVATVVAPGKAV